MKYNLILSRFHSFFLTSIFFSFLLPYHLLHWLRFSDNTMPALLSSTPPPSAMSSFIAKPTACTAIYSDSLSADTVAISPDVARSLYGTREPVTRYVVVHGIDQDTHTDRKWTIYRVNSSPTVEDNACVFSNSNKQAGGPPAGSRILVQAVNPVDLDQLLILCTPDSYDELKENKSEITTRLLNGLDSRIVRQGEFDTNISALFKLCEPVDQGLLTRNTKLTVIQGSARQIEEYDDIEVEIANYLGYNKDHTEQELDVLPLEEQVNVNSLIPKPELKDDPQSRAFVRVEQLINIGVFSGDTVS